MIIYIKIVLFIVKYGYKRGKIDKLVEMYKNTKEKYQKATKKSGNRKGKLRHKNVRLLLL